MVDDYTFAVLFEGRDDSADPPQWIHGGSVGDGQYGLESALGVLPIYQGMAADPDSLIRNVVFVYAPRITWSTWDMSE